ncbi:MAG: hypothetical protein ABL866_06085 [Devosia sp.]
MLASYLAALTLLAVGYIPMQALRTRRAALIAAAIGIILIPLAIFGFGQFNAGPNGLVVVVGMLWVCIVAYGIFCGGIMRYIILGRASLTPLQRWGMIAGGYLVFVAVGWFGLSQVAPTL